MLALLFVAQAAAAQAPAPPPPAHSRDTRASAADARAPVQAQHPDAALLEYLGEFDEAADGLDAMGLEESTQGNSKGDDGKTNGGRRMRIER